MNSFEEVKMAIAKKQDIAEVKRVMGELGVTIEDLQSEPPQGPEKPRVKFVQETNAEPLRDIVQSYINFVWSDDYGKPHFGDRSHYVFEAAVKMFCGKDVFDAINERGK